MNSNLFKASIEKFGASDCNCTSHLFYSEIKPQFEMIHQNIIQQSINYENLNKIELNIL